LAFGGTTLPAAGTATIFGRSSDNNLYLQSGSGNNINFLDGSQNTMYSVSPTSHLWAISNSTKMTLDASGNLGLGITPSAWSTSWKALQISSRTSLSEVAGITFLGNNFYQNTSSQNIYLQNGSATLYYQNAGQHNWQAAPSGTAGSVATLTQILAVEGSKSLALEGATSQSGTGITFPATQSASSNANTLDDYEEGTWTPVATSQLGSITAYTSSGTYTKVGRIVYLSGEVNITTSGTASGVLSIAGYPFASGSSGTIAQLGGANETQLTGTAYQVRISPGLTSGFINALTGGAVAFTAGSGYSFSLAYST
jgi:hypothetical protein